MAAQQNRTISQELDLRRVGEYIREHSDYEVLKSLLEVLGLKRVVEAAGIKEAVEAVGVEQTLAAIGEEDIVAKLTPERREERRKRIRPRRAMTQVSVKNVVPVFAGLVVGEGSVTSVMCGPRRGSW